MSDKYPTFITDDQPAGLLNKNQRCYLRPNCDYKPTNEPNFRKNLRYKVLRGLADFRLLYHFQSDKERELTFRQSDYEAFIDEMTSTPNRRRFGTSSRPERGHRDWTILGMHDAISYFYRGLDDRGLEPSNFAELLRNAVKQAVEDSEEEDVIAEVEVSIDVKLSDERLSELRDRFINGEGLSKEQLNLLLDTDPSVVPEALVSGLSED